MHLKNFWIDLILIIGLIFFSSCSFNGKNVARITNLQTERVKENTTAARIANQVTKEQINNAQTYLVSSNYLGTGKSLDLAEESTGLTDTFLRRNQNLVGLPSQPQEPVVQALLSTNNTIKTEAQEVQKSKESQEIKWITERNKREQELIKMGEEYEIIKNKSIVKRFWGWLVGGLGVFGAIAFIVFCPAIAIPLLGHLAGWIVGVIPKISNFIGIVSKKAFKGVASGIGTVRDDLKRAKELTPDKKFTAAEVLKLLDTQLAIHLDKDDKKVVEQVREEINL